MSYLLDTHVVLWWLFDDRRLSRRTRALIRDPQNQILVSSASAWEITTKHRLGRLAAAAPLVREFSSWMAKARFSELSIRWEHAARAGSWEVGHRDPFDRMLAAQATTEGLPLVSRDPVFADFGLDTVW